MKAGAEFPPVVVFTDSNSVHWLADGHHRISAAESAGLTEIAVEQRFGERRAAILYSLGANAAHGQRRSNDDKRRAVDKMLDDKEWETWADNRIAEHCGVSDTFVTQRRKVIEKARGSNRWNLKRKGRDGKSYPAHRRTVHVTKEYAQDLPAEPKPALPAATATKPVTEKTPLTAPIARTPGLESLIQMNRPEDRQLIEMAYGQGAVDGRNSLGVDDALKTVEAALAEGDNRGEIVYRLRHL